MLAWTPLVALGFVAVVYCAALRRCSRSPGIPIPPRTSGAVVLYEVLRFSIFYVLFCGVQFGVRSYMAWHAERLRAERHERLSQQAQLLQLTQQLQPHFLFNALNTVSSLIHSDPDLADALLTQLAALLRAATDAGQRPEQPLADELKLLRGYAAIMVERFGDRVRLRWDIDDGRAALRACRRSALQPLLENCFRHVVEPRRATTHIVVRARRDGALLVIEVEDDGGVLAAPPVFGVGLRQPAAPAARRCTAPRRARSCAPREGGGVGRDGAAAMRVLIVDDEAPARAQLRRMLGGVRRRRGGRRGGRRRRRRWSWSASSRPTRCSSTCRCPRSSGLDVAASLPDGAPALVFVTAFDRFALQAFDANAVDYLLKPVEPERLARAVQRLRAPAGAARRTPARRRNC